MKCGKDSLTIRSGITLAIAYWCNYKTQLNKKEYYIIYYH